MTLLVLPGWWNFKLESTSLKDKHEEFITLKNEWKNNAYIPIQYCPRLGLYIPNSIPNLVTSTFIGNINFFIYNLLDPVCFKLVGWTVSFVFPDQI